VASAEPVARRFGFNLVGDLKLDLAPRRLIGPWLDRDSQASTFGDPGSAKSFMAIDQGLSVASGTPWFGSPVHQVPVLYIAGEGRRGLMVRCRAWAQHHGINLADVPFALSSGPTALGDEASLAEVIQAIDVFTDKTGKPGLVVIDTLARNFGGADENSTPDMNRYVTASDRIRAHCGGATIHHVHHSGHSDKGRARGNGSLRGALDMEFCATRTVTKDKQIIFGLTCTKAKDSAFPDPIYFHLRRVVLVGPDGLPLIDEDGQPVSSAVLEQAVPAKVEEVQATDDVADRIMGIIRAEPGLVEEEITARAKKVGLRVKETQRHLKALVGTGRAIQTGGSKSEGPARFHVGSEAEKYPAKCPADAPPADDQTDGQQLREDGQRRGIAHDLAFAQPTASPPKRGEAAEHTGPEEDAGTGLPDGWDDRLPLDDPPNTDVYRRRFHAEGA